MILAAFIERGFHVSIIFLGGQPYDLIVDLGQFDVLKVQCKTGWHEKRRVAFNTRSTDHGRGRRSRTLALRIFLLSTFRPKALCSSCLWTPYKNYAAGAPT